ncbi:MAG TPA: nicotinamide-nucleotide amidohydrolase family protein [Beijerinckiaceae bacterium]|nr:nicotinamide-nucleotide amidohydrolase family protein [Beijerinckiaceae bacterium]
MSLKDRTALARTVLAAARRQGLTIATAESCTGGMVAAALTDIAGSSDVVDRGFVTYSNAAKTAMLGVPEGMIQAHGAVSAEVAAAMALGALKQSQAGLAVAVTGIAGPAGATAGKPVGLVHFAVAARDGRVNRLEMRYGALGRRRVRAAATATALRLLAEMLDAGAVQFA